MVPLPKLGPFKGSGRTSISKGGFVQVSKVNYLVLVVVGHDFGGCCWDDRSGFVVA